MLETEQNIQCTDSAQQYAIYMAKKKIHTKIDNYICSNVCVNCCFFFFLILFDKSDDRHRSTFARSDRSTNRMSTKEFCVCRESKREKEERRRFYVQIRQIPAIFIGNLLKKKTIKQFFVQQQTKRKKKYSYLHKRK